MAQMVTCLPTTQRATTGPDVVQEVGLLSVLFSNSVHQELHLMDHREPAGGILGAAHLRHSGRCDAGLPTSLKTARCILDARKPRPTLHSPYWMLARDTYPRRSKRERARCPCWSPLAASSVVWCFSLSRYTSVRVTPQPCGRPSRLVTCARSYLRLKVSIAVRAQRQPLDEDGLRELSLGLPRWSSCHPGSAPCSCDDQESIPCRLR
jgi:hypothetical protein